MRESDRACCRGIHRLVLPALCVAVLLFGCMPYELKTVLDGPQGKALSISPATTVVSTANTFDFSAGGGVGPYFYSLVSGGGSVDAVTGLYTAPATAGSAVIRVTDKTGKTADATVTIQVLSLSLAISPTAIALNVGGSITFIATGGTPPYSFSIQSNFSGCTLTGPDYIAGPASGTDVVQVTDSALPPVTRTANVTVSSLPLPDYAVSFDPNIPWSGVVSDAMSNTGTTQIAIQNGPNPGHTNIAWAVYLSTDNVLDAGDTLVQQGTIGPLGASASAPVTFAGNWSAAPGRYFLIAAIQSADDSSIANNVVIGHMTGIGTYRYQEGAEDNSSVGTPPPGPTPPSGPTSDTAPIMSPLGVNETLVIEGVMDAYGENDTYQFTVGAGLSRLSIQTHWASGWDDIDTYVWDTLGGYDACNGGGIDAEPTPGTGDFTPAVSGPGTWYVNQNFYLGAGLSGSTGKKYLILVQGLP